MSDNTIQDEFIATISHEMRTPLTSIRGFSQTMLASWDKLDEASKKRFVKIIEEQSNRLINLVENVLAVSKINSDKPIIKEVNINNSVEKIIQIISQKYKNHKINTNLNKNIPSLSLDEEKIQQILLNLIDNACKYSNEGTNVTITTSFSNSNTAFIKIKDEGVGISEDNISKIFDKFVRLENHLTEKTQGNGLGLYITKKLVESMNGKISVKSELQKGTEFILEFSFYNHEEMLKCSQQS